MTLSAMIVHAVLVLGSWQAGRVIGRLTLPALDWACRRAELWILTHGVFL